MAGTNKHTISPSGQRIGRPEKHGMYGTPEYRSWNRMLDRCRNVNSDAYSSYGGRGIHVCDRWLSFEDFLGDMGPRPIGKTLDRVNNDGNYEPSNCRWSTYKEQASNRRNPKSDRPRANSKSGVRGVRKMPNGKWRAVISVNKVKHHLGYFENLAEASIAIEQARLSISF